MPVQIPLKSTRETVRFPVAIDIWSTILAGIASTLALLVYLATGHTTGAALVLVLVAALVGLVLYVCRHPGGAGDI